MHCCPSGMKCNNEQGSCDSIDNSTKIQASLIQTKNQPQNVPDINSLQSVVCPDG